MAYVDSQLLPGEQVIYRAHMSKRIYVRRRMLVHVWECVRTDVARWLLLSTMAMACSSPVDPACNSDPDVTVTNPDLVPTFNWSGDCGVTHLTVVRTATNQSVWSLIARDERKPFGSPVQYGSRVAGTDEPVAPTALHPGGTYRVEIRMIVGGDGIGASGFAVFTHQPQ